MSRRISASSSLERPTRYREATQCTLKEITGLICSCAPLLTMLALASFALLDRMGICCQMPSVKTLGWLGVMQACTVVDLMHAQARTQVLASPELRKRYDAKGAEGVDVDFMDHAEFFNALFGSDRFEHLVGELMIAAASRHGELNGEQMRRVQASSAFQCSHARNDCDPNLMQQILMGGAPSTIHVMPAGSSALTGHEMMSPTCTTERNCRLA